MNDISGHELKPGTTQKLQIENQICGPLLQRAGQHPDDLFYDNLDFFRHTALTRIPSAFSFYNYDMDGRNAYTKSQGHVGKSIL